MKTALLQVLAVIGVIAGVAIGVISREIIIVPIDLHSLIPAIAIALVMIVIFLTTTALDR